MQQEFSKRVYRCFSWTFAKWSRYFSKCYYTGSVMMPACEAGAIPTSKP